MCTVKEEVVNIWKSVLDMNDVENDKWFFDVGGSSIAAIQLINELKGIGVNIDIDRFYRDPTIDMILSSCVH